MTGGGAFDRSHVDLRTASRAMRPFGPPLAYVYAGSTESTLDRASTGSTLAPETPRHLLSAARACSAEVFALGVQPMVQSRAKSAIRLRMRAWQRACR